MDMIFKILMPVSGLALFLFGMDTTGDSLRRSVGSHLKVKLGKMTSNQNFDLLYREYGEKYAL